jgi:hypothetical protein
MRDRFVCTAQAILLAGADSIKAQCTQTHVDSVDKLQNMSLSLGGVALHERIFAQVLGVVDTEEFADELTDYAAELIQDLPPGWELVIGEGELAGIPMYVYTETQETEWSHPYESEYRRRIQARRNELLASTNDRSSLRQQSTDRANEVNLFASSSFNAETIETDFNDSSEAYIDEPGSLEQTRNVDQTPRDDVKLQDYEIVFAEVLGVQVGEKYYPQLSLLARDLLKILPEGWELLQNDANGVRVPYFYEMDTGMSHWTHPFEGQFKEVIANKRVEFESAGSSPRSPLHTARSRRSEVSMVSAASAASMDEGERQALVEAMFAGSLGINPLEEFAAELGDYAKELLETLPAGWEVVVADNGTSDGIFPLFVNTASGESQMDHPMLVEHTESIVDMRNALMYGVLPGQFEAATAASRKGGASAEPSAQYLAQQRAAEQARAEAEERDRSALEAQAARELAERVAADEVAAEEERRAEEARLRRETEERAALEEVARVEAEQQAVEERARQEAADRAAKEAAEAAAAALEVERAAEEARELEVAAAARAVAAAEEQHRQEDARQAAAEGARIAEDRAREAAEAAQAEAAEGLARQEAQRLAEEGAVRELTASIARQLQLDEEAAAAAAHEKQLRLQTEQDDAVQSERASPAHSVGQLEDGSVASVLSEGTALTAGYASVDGAQESATLGQTQEALPIPASAPQPEAEDPVPAPVDEGGRTVDVVVTVEAPPSPAVELTAGIAPTAEPATADPSAASASAQDDEARRAERSEAENVDAESETASHLSGVAEHTAAALTDEVVAALALETAASSLVGEQHLYDSVASAVTEAVVTEVSRETARALAKEALALAAAERAAAEQAEEERVAAARTERRAAERKAAEAAAEEARHRAVAEEAALNASAESLFQQQLELARQTAVHKEQAPVLAPDAVEATEKDAFSTEPETLSQTMVRGGSARVLVPPQEEPFPNTGRLSAAASGVTLPAPTVPTPSAPVVVPAFDLASIGSNAVRMKTQYLDLLGKAPKDKDGKRRTSKRVTSPEAPELAAAKLRDAKQQSEAKDSSSVAEVAESGAESSGAEEGKLRPLSKVSPKKLAQKRKHDSRASMRSPSRRSTAGSALSPGHHPPQHKERLWEVRVEPDSAERAVTKMRWYTLGCYQHYEEAIMSRKAVCKMAVADSQGTIVIDPRLDISDFDLVASFRAEEQSAADKEFASRPGTTALGGFASLFSPPRATTADAALGGGSSGGVFNLRGASAASPSRVGGSVPGTAVSGSGAGALGRTVPAPDDTKEMILGRVKRTTEKCSKVRIRKDLSRMQWVVETDELEISRIADRHRKKKGVDIEGKSEDAVKVKAKNALRAMQRAKETEGDVTFQTLKSLPPMEELVQSDLLQVLSNAKSFGGFSLTSRLVENEKRLKEELADKLGKLNRRSEAPRATTKAREGRSAKVTAGAGAGAGAGSGAGSIASASSGSSKLASAASVSSKNRLILPSIASSKQSTRQDASR